MSATILLVGIPQLSRSRALALTGLAAGMLGSLSLAAMSVGAKRCAICAMQSGAMA